MIISLIFAFLFADVFLVADAQIADEYNVPLAPYNVKLMCRQGRRYTKVAQTPQQCPSSSTSCGFFEFPTLDSRNGNEKTGVYDCVDGGILHEDSGEEIDDDRKRPPIFAKMCGAVPKCTTLRLDQMNKAFVKYVVQEYDIKLENLDVPEIRFCCALFHTTLQKLVTSPEYSLPQISAPPVTCQGKTCDAGAVGCLLHAVHGDDDYEEYDDKRKRRYKRLSLNDYIEDDEEDYVSAVELNFDDLDIELITRETPIETTTTPTLPSLRLPMSISELEKSRTTTRPMTTTTTTSTTTTTPLPNSQSKTFVKQPDSYEDEEPNQSTHCVYRHLNNEFYRYCLLVHQSRDGDRCYHHQGHTICCCFVAPDRETCDPTEMDLIVPPPQGGALPPRVIVTVPPTTTSTTTTTTTTTSTTTTTTTPPPTTTTTTPTPTKYPPLPPQIYRQRPIDQIKKRKKQKPKKCRVTYIRSKSGSRTRPMLVCESSSTPAKINYYLLLSLFCSFLVALYW